MAATQNQRPRVPTVGTPAAEAFIAELEARIAATEAKFEKEFMSFDEIEAQCLKSGMNALTNQIRKENGDDRYFTKKKAEPKKAKTKKRVRVSI
jgi:hypothetical protein